LPWSDIFKKTKKIYVGYPQIKFIADWYGTNTLIGTCEKNNINHILNTRKFIDAQTNKINWI